MFSFIYQLGHRSKLPGVFKSQEEVNDYHSIWHKDIYMPAINNIQNVDSIWQLPILQRNR